MEWVFVALAIVLEITGTVCMKLSEGLTRLIPSLVMAVSYLACFSFLALSLKKLPVGPVYAIWSAVGTAVISSIGILYFREPLTMIKLVSILLIIVGVVGLRVDVQ